MNTGYRACGLAALLACASACTHHEIEVKPIRVETIRIQVDVNIKLQQQLEEMFAFEEAPKNGPKDTSPKQDKP